MVQGQGASRGARIGPSGATSTASKASPVDPQVRAEVEELLALEGSGDALLGVTQWRDQLEFEPFKELSGGMTIGSYRIVREIGRGGMGVVYLAERSDGAYKQRVALKLLQTGLRSTKDDTALSARASDSCRPGSSGNRSPCGRWRKSGRAPVSGVGICRGPSHRPILREEHNLDTKARLRLFLKVADVVQSAHQQLVLHLDLKPANILITTDGEPRLLDFGIRGFSVRQTRETICLPCC